MGCQGSKEAGDTNGNSVDYRNVAAVGDNNPPPYIPERTRAEIYDPEVNKDIQARIDKIPQGTDKSYATLLKYLSEGATKEIHHVTAIYLWMKYQNYNDIRLDLEKAGDTPRAYMKLIKEGTGDLTSFFTILCRRSNIPCTIISGLGKDKDYCVGTPEAEMYTKWCAVYADGEWRFVHVEWSLQHTKDANQNNSSMKDDNFFFFTDPDDFATFCLPENFRWQLVRKSYTKREFLNLPNMRPQFFTMTMTIIQPKTGYMKSHTGKVEVELTFPRKIANKVFLSFLHSYNEDLDSVTEDGGSGSSKSSINLPTALEKYVFMNRKPSRCMFEIYLPVAGRYLFDVYGEVEDDGKLKKDRVLQRLCQFRIFSKKTWKSNELEPLPDSPSIGWGPGPVCRHLGLIPLTHFDSCLYMRAGETRLLKFRMERKLDVLCQLVHNYLPVDELADQLDCSQEDGQLTVDVQIKEDGQYALKIYCREAGTKDFDEACVYLIRQRYRTKLPEKYRNRMLRRRLEEHLNNHTSETGLQDALDVFVCYAVPDNGEIQRSQDKLQQYWQIKQGLVDATKGRNHNVIRKWVQKARNSRFEPDLEDDIQRAEMLDENIMKLKGYAHPIARMDPQSINEIRRYKRPPSIVHDVMKSTYLLLGENRFDVEDWEQIQYLMGKQGKDSLQKRICAISPDDIRVGQADDAEAAIYPYSMAKCRQVSNGICSFYRWNKQCINDVRRREMTPTEMKNFNHQQAGRDTFRETNSVMPPGSTTSREPVTPNERKGSSETQVDHPFVIEEHPNNLPEENTERKFFLTALTPTENLKSQPVAYAGWKPSNAEYVTSREVSSDENNARDSKNSKQLSPKPVENSTKCTSPVTPVEEQHPFSVDETPSNDDVNETSQRQFFRTAITPTRTKKAMPISYSGWKPADV